MNEPAITNNRISVSEAIGSAFLGILSLLLLLLFWRSEARNRKLLAKAPAPHPPGNPIWRRLNPLHVHAGQSQ